jgi:hypothetical protein
MTQASTSGELTHTIGGRGYVSRSLRHGRGESWARTAAEHGYYDEAHMANDISELAGSTRTRCWNESVRCRGGSARC